MRMLVFGCGTWLAHDAAVLIRRCAWHREYYGYPMVFGISSWGEFRPTFTDGMCLRCTARFRRQWHLPELEARRFDFGSPNSWARAAVVVLFVAASVTLVTRQFGDMRTRETVTAPPETVLVPPVPVEAEPAQAIANRSRRARVPKVTPADAPRQTPFALARAAERAESMAAIPPAVVPIAEPVAADPASVVIASPVVFAAVPHAGLMQQAP